MLCHLGRLKDIGSQEAVGTLKLISPGNWTKFHVPATFLEIHAQHKHTIAFPLNRLFTEKNIVADSPNTLIVSLFSDNELQHSHCLWPSLVTCSGLPGRSIHPIAWLGQVSSISLARGCQRQLAGCDSAVVSCSFFTCWE